MCDLMVEDIFLEPRGWELGSQLHYLESFKYSAIDGLAMVIDKIWDKHYGLKSCLKLRSFVVSQRVLEARYPLSIDRMCPMMIESI